MNMLFWGVVNGTEPKGVDDHFIGKDGEGLFVARLRLEKGREYLPCIDIERPETSETAFFYSKCLFFIPFLSRWIGQLKAGIGFQYLKSEKMIEQKELVKNELVKLKRDLQGQEEK